MWSDPRTDSMISVLVIYTVNTGMIVAWVVWMILIFEIGTKNSFRLNASLVMITYGLKRNTFIYLGIFCCSSPWLHFSTRYSRNLSVIEQMHVISFELLVSDWPLWFPVYLNAYLARYVHWCLDLSSWTDFIHQPQCTSKSTFQKGKYDVNPPFSNITVPLRSRNPFAYHRQGWTRNLVAHLIID